MNIAYILIVLWFPASSQSGKAIQFQEFTTQENCHAAAREVKRVGNGDLVQAWCTRK